MPNVVTQTPLAQPSNGTQSFAIQDMEMAKFRLANGTVTVAVSGPDGAAIAGATYAEGGSVTAGAGTAPFLAFRGTLGTTTIVGTGSPLPVTLQTLGAGEDLPNNVLGVLPKPVASSTYAPLDATNFGQAAGTGVLIKATNGNVYSAYVTSATTAIRYFQLFNQSTVPVVGQTPVASYPMGSVPAGGIYELKLDSSHFAPSKHFTNGIAAAISSTPGTLGTASITIADYSWHIKYV